MVFPLMMKAAFPVGAANKTFELSGLLFGSLLKYRIRLWNKDLTKTVFPTPAPPVRNA